MALRILFFGDIVGSAGRAGIREVLPKWRREHQPDLVIGNVENLAHGKGVTRKTLGEVFDAGLDFATSGNHIWDKPEGIEILRDPDPKVLRPANYPTDVGVGEKVVTFAKKRVLVVNLMGRVFIPEDCDDPFRTLDAILARHADDRPDGIIVDFHAEATSEKVALGWYVDGRVSAVLGTHTHVPTADAQVLPGGTAYCSDVGMVGPTDSVIGVRKEQVIQRFLHQTPTRFDVMDRGPVVVNAVLVEIAPRTGRATAITQLRETFTIA